MRYAKYKPTGIAPAHRSFSEGGWLPEVPEGWEVRRLASFGMFSKGGGMSRADLQEQGEPVILYGDIYTKYEFYANEIKNHVSKDVASRSVSVFYGDLLMTGSGETREDIGKCIVFLGKTACAGGDVIIYRQEGQDSKFLSYALSAPESKRFRYRKARGEIIVHISVLALRQLCIPLPPLAEQKAIAAYLDDKCSKVDALVAAKTKEVKLLKELRERVIADAVTGRVRSGGVKSGGVEELGGDFNAEKQSGRGAESLRGDARRFKPSGIFWQPEMPEHWIVRKLKYVLTKLRRDKKPEAELLVCTNKGTVIRRGESKMGLVSDDISIYQGVKQGDLLIHGMDTWHGAVAVSGEDGMCTPVVHVCDSNDDKRFVAYYLRNMARGRVFKLISNGVRQNTSDFRSWEKLAALPIILPPLAEQKAIVEYIEKKTAKIDELAAKLEDEVVKLKEYRERLVADVVTGQRKVV